MRAPHAVAPGTMPVRALTKHRAPARRTGRARPRVQPERRAADRKAGVGDERHPTTILLSRPRVSRCPVRISPHGYLAAREASGRLQRQHLRARLQTHLLRTRRAQSPTRTPAPRWRPHVLRRLGYLCLLHPIGTYVTHPCRHHHPALAGHVWDVDRRTMSWHFRALPNRFRTHDRLRSPTPNGSFFCAVGPTHAPTHS